MSEDPPQRPPLIRFLNVKLRLLLILVLLPSFLAWMGRLHWTLELTTHFRLHYLVAALILTILLAVLRDGSWTAVAASVMLLNAVPVLPIWFSPPRLAAAPKSTPVKMLLANVYTANTDHGPLLDLLTRESPDVIVLQEVNDRWQKAMKPLEESHPFSRCIPREDNFGIGLWSRLPLRRIEVFDVDPVWVPSIQVEVQTAEYPITVIATHPVPPVRRENAEARNLQLVEVARRARGSLLPVVLLGDLNATPWSPHFQTLVQDSGLRDARLGFGPLPSWPVHLPIARIPLDHCLVGPTISVRGIRVGPAIGSDHLPVIVDLLMGSPLPR